MHITTLCITISLCATVALACLFSPKVYIIIFHPEKNMRLTKQLKAQANSLKFASQLATKSDFILNNRMPSHDLSTSDGQSKSLTENDHDESLGTKPIKFKTLTNNHEKNNKEKLPIIITTNQSDKDKYQLKIQKYNYDDNDSLNSNPLHEEDVML